MCYLTNHTSSGLVPGPCGVALGLKDNLVTFRISGTKMTFIKVSIFAHFSPQRPSVLSSLKKGSFPFTLFFSILFQLFLRVLYISS
jgi:hypothetical protein